MVLTMKIRFCCPQPTLKPLDRMSATSDAHRPFNWRAIDFSNGITVLGNRINATFGLTTSGTDRGPVGRTTLVDCT